MNFRFTKKKVINSIFIGYFLSIIPAMGWYCGTDAGIFGCLLMSFFIALFFDIIAAPIVFVIWSLLEKK